MDSKSETQPKPTIKLSTNKDGSCSITKYYNDAQQRSTTILIDKDFNIVTGGDIDKKIRNRIEERKKRFHDAPKKGKFNVRVNITVELVAPYEKGDQIKTALPRILREFADIEESPAGAQNAVETYYDNYGHRLTCMVVGDYGSEIPYLADGICCPS